MNLRLASLMLGLVVLTACQGGGKSPVSDATPAVAAPAEEAPVAAAESRIPDKFEPVMTTPEALDDLTTVEAMGVYWLEYDKETQAASLTQARTLSAQGDLYSLSIRPFMGPQHLQLTSMTPVEGEPYNRYTFRFEHPIAMPTDLNRPQSATKRVDLFINDVTLTAVVQGTEAFLGNSHFVNPRLMRQPDAFRHVRGLVDETQLGVTNFTGLNIYPYRLISRASMTGNAYGNYGTDGWRGNEFLNPTGLDTIPHAAVVPDITMEFHQDYSQIPLVVIAKYMDPRKGQTAAQKRANRLPDPNDFSACFYYLPEAAGDIQSIQLDVTGTLRDDRNSDVVTIDYTILDWDNAAPVLNSHVLDANQPRSIRHLSRPTNLRIDFPQLHPTPRTPAQGPGAGFGPDLQFVGGNFTVFNQRMTHQVTSPLGEDLYGLAIVQDNPAEDHMVGVDENLQPLSTMFDQHHTIRFQLAKVRMLSALTAPLLTNPTSLSGATGEELFPGAVNVGGVADSWLWDFGGGAFPNTSTEPIPQIALGAVGYYNGSVTATNSMGNSTVNFVLYVGPFPPPFIQAVAPTSGESGKPTQFIPTNAGGTATAISWDFGGGATPNTPDGLTPTVTLGAIGTYNASVTASNTLGQHTFHFTLTVNPAKPELTAVSPLGGTPGQARTFTATNTGGAPTTWSWNFGGGASPNTSTAASPSVTLTTTPGNYNASVTATNVSGNSTFNFVLTVSSAAPNLTAVTPLSAPQGASRTFSATNTGGVATSWSWNFGGGASPNTSTASNPTVTITGTNGSTYNCSVTATNGGGNSTFNFVLTVTIPLPNIIAVSPLSGSTSQSRTFSLTNTGGAISSYSWNFGGGASPNTSTAASPTVNLASSPGTYSASVTGTNASGNHTFNFTLTVNPPPPVISFASIHAPDVFLQALRPTTASATASNSPTSWSWNFGGGATPNTSTDAVPSITLGQAGGYTCTVTASNASGTSAPYTFNYTVVNYATKLRVKVITNGSTFPTPLSGMASWSSSNLQSWVSTNITPIFSGPGGLLVHGMYTSYSTVNNPALFNIDTVAEENQLWDLILTEPSDRINIYIVNSLPLHPSNGGFMKDTSPSCNSNNAQRGCYIISTGFSATDRYLFAHEIAHVMHLPHIRTATSPLTGANNNLMSYGMNSNVLSSSITREVGPPCFLYIPPTMNQFQVLNNWVHNNI